MHQKKKMYSKIDAKNASFLKIGNKRSTFGKKRYPLWQKKMKLNRTRSPIQLQEKTDDQNVKCVKCAVFEM